MITLKCEVKLKMNQILNRVRSKLWITTCATSISG